VPVAALSQSANQQLNLQRALRTVLQIMTGGTEWIIDAIGCAPSLLANPVAVRLLMDEAIASLQLTVLQSVVHQFDQPAGITAIALLAESHLTVHTFPESGVASINLYCCSPRPTYNWRLACSQALAEHSVMIRVAQRGLAAFESSTSDVATGIAS
jgi:S-adenosylmethionine decarboxylase